jgi:NTP pyrophosphatase (non-canonical NTP hydrolase)
MDQQQQEEKSERDERYKLSRDDTREMRNLLDRLIGEVGDLMVAIKGNDLGTEGIVGQLKSMKTKIEEFEARLNHIQSQAKLERFKMATIWSLLGALGMSLLYWIMEHVFGGTAPKIK